MANSHLLLLADFSCPDIDHGTMTVNAEDSYSTRFFGKTQDLFLCQCIEHHTGYCEGNAPSTMDYAFTDEANLMINVQYNALIGNIEHLCLVWELTVSQIGLPNGGATRKKNY
jgi:hypothetical protein